MLNFKKSRQINSINQIINYEIISQLDEEVNKPIYSIKVTAVDMQEPSTIIESQSSFNISYSLNQVRQLLVLFYNNTVLPSELLYIIDDYISTNIDFVFEEDSNDETLHTSKSECAVDSNLKKVI